MTMVRKGDVIELPVLDTAEEDACMGRLPEGMVVFVRGAVMPGDTVRAVVTKIKKNYLEARLETVLVPSPDRVAPVCAHYGICGGCKWQHVAYPRQAAFKQKLVQDALQRIGGFDEVVVAPPRAATAPYHYRNKVDFTFSNERFILEEELGIAPEQRATSPPTSRAGCWSRRAAFSSPIRARPIPPLPMKASCATWWSGMPGSPASAWST